MQGLRTQESKNFLNFFEIVQSTANKEGKVFFLDCGDDNLYEESNIECENMFGWLIKYDDVSEFENLYNQFKDIPDKFDKTYVFARWEKKTSL